MKDTKYFTLSIQWEGLFKGFNDCMLEFVRFVAMLGQSRVIVVMASKVTVFGLHLFTQSISENSRVNGFNCELICLIP